MPARRVPDDLDRRILDELRRDARASYRAIARALGVSTPTVALRVKRMEETGLIRGYRVDTPEPAPAPVPPVHAEGWNCAYCRAPLGAEAFTCRLGGRSYAFCCQVCRDDFIERHRRVSQRAREGPRAPRGLVPWAAGMVGLLGLAGACGDGWPGPHAAGPLCPSCPGPGLPPPGAFSLTATASGAPLAPGSGRRPAPAVARVASRSTARDDGSGARPSPRDENGA